MPGLAASSSAPDVLAKKGKMRRAGQPGPGAYDPKSTKDISTGASAAGTSAFNSKVHRAEMPTNETADPGKYDPHHSSVDAGKSFGWQSKGAAKRFPKTAKKGAFGGHSKRELHMEILGDAGVGPGSYMPRSTFGKPGLGNRSFGQAA